MPGVLVVPPGQGEQHWQPQPANGWIEVLTTPRLPGAPAGFSAGLQELPPLGKIREHAHPAQTDETELHGEFLLRRRLFRWRVLRGCQIDTGSFAVAVRLCLPAARPQEMPNVARETSVLCGPRWSPVAGSVREINRGRYAAWPGIPRGRAYRAVDRVPTHRVAG